MKSEAERRHAREAARAKALYWDARLAGASPFEARDAVMTLLWAETLAAFERRIAQARATSSS
jgi:hypothetical protein